jgi:Glycosyltransferase WbsX
MLSKITWTMKRTMYIAAFVLAFAACKKGDQHLPPDFNYAIDPVNITENVTVGAYYYNYSATDWAKKYSDTPELGEYSALNATVMAQHRQWADAGGVDFFIFNWNGTSGNGILNSFIKDRNNNVKMVINYNTAHLSATNASPLTGTKLNTMITELKNLASTHFGQDYYQKVDGKPAILITPLNLSASAGASINYATVIPAVKQALKDAGVEVYIIGEITSGWLPPVRYAAAIKAMDGVDLSNWSTDVYDRSVFFPSFSDINWKNWTDSTTAWNKDYVPCIFPGFNDKTMTPASKIYDINRTPAFYTDYCNVAKRNMSKKRLVLINSWNNFQVGTALEPAKEYGSSYLEITKAQFKVK